MGVFFGVFENVNFYGVNVICYSICISNLEYFSLWLTMQSAEELMYLVVFGLIECILETETCRYMHIADRRPGFIASPTYIINKYFYFLSVRKHTCFIVLTQQCGPSNSAQFCGILHIFSLYGRMSV